MKLSMPATLPAVKLMSTVSLMRLLTLPFLVRYVLHWPHSLDIRFYEEALNWILGEHDFSAFKKKDEFYRNPG